MHIHRFHSTVLVTLAVGSSAFAADRHVPKEYPTIQAAVNASEHGDVIRVTAPSLAEHGIVIHDRTLTIEGAADGEVTVDAQQLGRHLHITGSSDVRLRNLRFVNGDAGMSSGGAIRFEGAQLLVGQCTFESNGAGFGGAIAVRAGQVRIVGARFTGNRADGVKVPYGGAIRHTGGNLTVAGTRFSGNSSGYTGGAVSHGWGGGDGEGSGAGVLRILSCVFDSNSAVYGGACTTYQSSSNLVVVNSTFRGNSALFGKTFQNYYGHVRLINTVVTGPGPLFQTYYAGGFRGLSCITSSDLLEGHGNAVADPLLSDDFAPQPGSPCIDSGATLRLISEFLALGEGSQCRVFALDYLGNPRLSHAGGVPGTGCVEADYPIDIGAVEAVGVAAAAPVVGDVDDDLAVDGSDLAMVLASWGSDACGADVDASGMVDAADLAVILAAWGTCTHR